MLQQLDNLKAVRALGWHFLTRLASNRTVNPDPTGQVLVSALEVGAAGRRIHLKGFGLIRLFRTVSRNGRGEHWATSRLEMRGDERAACEQKAWGIESSHQRLKQPQGRSVIGQGNHLLLSGRAYLRLEVHRLRTGVSHFEAKCQIVREAMRSFLADPMLVNLATA